MIARRCLCLVPVVLLIGCASKEGVQPVAQQADGSAATSKAATPRDTSSGGGAQVAGVSLPAGTLFHVRLGETLDTSHNRAGDRFSASLMEPVVVEGRTVIPRGANCSGHLIQSSPSGRLKGRAEMSLSLDSFELNGRSYPIQTSHVARESGSHKKRNAGFIGGGAGLGAALGAIAGGGKGALIGAGAGAAAGTTGAVLTGKKNVHIPVETPLSFSLRAPVSLS